MPIAIECAGCRAHYQAGEDGTFYLGPIPYPCEICGSDEFYAWTLGVQTPPFTISGTGAMCSVTSSSGRLRIDLQP